MGLNDVTAEGVKQAIQEFNQMGRDAFLKKYGFGEALRYFLIHEGRRYDSKAVVGVAHKYDQPTLGPLQSQAFSGGDATVGRLLESLGFNVEEGSRNPSWTAQVEVVAVEAQHVERFQVSSPAQVIEATRREQSLVHAYECHLRSRGCRVKRHVYTVCKTGHKLVCDLVDETCHVLYEAKGDVLRESVRMAIGQLLDYHRHEKAKTKMKLAVLLPCQPGQDLIKLINSVPASVVWRTNDGFECCEPSPADIRRALECLRVYEDS